MFLLCHGRRGIVEVKGGHLLLPIGGRRAGANRGRKKGPIGQEGSRAGQGRAGKCRAGKCKNRKGRRAARVQRTSDHRRLSVDPQSNHNPVPRQKKVGASRGTTTTRTQHERDRHIPNILHSLLLLLSLLLIRPTSRHKDPVLPCSNSFVSSVSIPRSYTTTTTLPQLLHLLSPRLPPPHTSSAHRHGHPSVRRGHQGP